MSINTKDLIAEVRKVAEAQPDYVYYVNNSDTELIGCSYLADALGNPEGQPCLIGQALRNLEVHVPRKHENTEIDTLLNDCEIDVVVSDPEDVVWLYQVQNQQDSGHSWGQSVRYANQFDHEVYL